MKAKAAEEASRKQKEKVAETREKEAAKRAAEKNRKRITARKAEVAAKSHTRESSQKQARKKKEKQAAEKKLKHQTQMTAKRAAEKREKAKQPSHLQKQRRQHLPRPRGSRKGMDPWYTAPVQLLPGPDLNPNSPQPRVSHFKARKPVTHLEDLIHGNVRYTAMKKTPSATAEWDADWKTYAVNGTEDTCFRDLGRDLRNSLTVTRRRTCQCLHNLSRLPNVYKDARTRA